MARTKLTANNHCHKPIKGGEAVEALIEAAKNGEDACLAYLAGRHPDQVCSDNGIGVLHALVRKGSGHAKEQAAMDVLIALGANVDARNFRGQTPLLCAVNAGSWWAISKLCDAGADILVSDNKGRTTISVMVDWISRHPDKATSGRELIARISARKLDMGVAQASTPGKPSSPRF